MDYVEYQYSFYPIHNLDTAINWVYSICAIFPDITNARFIYQCDEDSAFYVNRSSEHFARFVLTCAEYMKGKNIDEFIFYDEGLLSVHLSDIL